MEEIYEINCFRIFKNSGKIVGVLLLPQKDKSGYTYINLTKGHICPCVFTTIEETIEDLNKHDVKYIQPLKLSSESKINF
jgi:hypothetical protein